tara:strand:+ start:247 stop:453 length:207 start_codon:yes stop_codon:yes gene_type:complete
VLKVVNQVNKQYRVHFVLLDNKKMAMTVYSVQKGDTNLIPKKKIVFNARMDERVKMAQQFVARAVLVE